MHSPLKNSAVQKGFTLIELLVVAPVAIIAISTMIALMVGLVGDVIISQERTNSTYTVQEALDRIEQDARIATQFMESFSMFESPQGRDGNVAPFNISNGDMIFSQYGSSSNPYDTNRTIVYYADQPNPCGGSVRLNRPFTVRVIYFTTDDAFGTKTLWRRTVVPDWSTIQNTTYKVCIQPWQRDSCPPPVTTLTANCRTSDEKMAENVSSLTTTYYAENGIVTTNPTSAVSLSVSITTTRQISGETLTNTGTVRAYHVNTTTDVIPEAPSVSLYNEFLNLYNNPIRTTFTWDAVQGAAVYGIRYRLNGGGWVTMPDQTGTQFQLDAARPLDAITIEVTSKNDMGASAATSFSHTKPLWTYANLQNGWNCYQPSEANYACPSYTLSSGNLLLIRGLAAGGDPSQPVFQLPIGLRPMQRIMFTTFGDDTAQRVDVLPDGRIYPGNGSLYLSLDQLALVPNGLPGITWTEGIGNTAQGWSNWGGTYGDYGRPRYTVDGAGRINIIGMMLGSSAVLTSGTNMLGFNSAYRPILTGIYPSIHSAWGFAFFPFQISTTSNVQVRGMGDANSWAYINATYWPNSSTSTTTQHALTLENSWANYGGSYNTAGYAKGSDNVVSLKGLVRYGSTARYTVIGTLPAGFRPGKSYAFMTSGYRTTPSTTQIPARIDVNPNGTITIMNLSTDNLSNGYLSLEGIHFYQEN